MKRIYCEACESNDLVKQGELFVCEACGCKYSLAEAQKQVVEPAHLPPLDKRIVDTALKFRDDELAKSPSKKEADIQKICDELRAGMGSENITTLFKVRTSTDYEGSPCAPYFFECMPHCDYPCAQELLAEGLQNAASFKSCMYELRARVMPKPKQGLLEMKKAFYAREKELLRNAEIRLNNALEEAGVVPANPLYVELVIGKFLVCSYIRLSVATCQKILTQANIKQIFTQAEELYKKGGN